VLRFHDRLRSAMQTHSSQHNVSTTVINLPNTASFTALQTSQYSSQPPKTSALHPQLSAPPYLPRLSTPAAPLPLYPHRPTTAQSAQWHQLPISALTITHNRTEEVYQRTSMASVKVDSLRLGGHSSPFRDRVRHTRGKT